MMHTFLKSLALACTLLFVACTGEQLGEATRIGLIASGEDEATAEKAGSAVSKGVGALEPVPFERERAIGGGIAVSSFATQGRLHPDGKLQQYVNMIGLSLARNTPREGFPFAFAVVESDDVNAWAAPGNYVFITSGAVREMDDEAMLAGVLAHEIAHVTEAHMLKMMQRGQLISAMIEGSQAAFEEDVTQYSGIVGEGTNILFDKGIDRSMEYEADAVGVEFAALTGYDPTGLKRYLEKLNTSAGNKGGGWLQSTHPPLTERINRLQVKLSTEMEGIEGATAKDRFQTIVGGALGN